MAKNKKFWKTFVAGSDDIKQRPERIPLRKVSRSLPGSRAPAVQLSAVFTRHMRHSVRK